MSLVLRHQLRAGGLEITVRVVRSAQRKRTIAVQVAPNGQVTIRAPLGTKQRRMEEVLRAKTTWLEARLNPAWDTLPQNRVREFVAGETFLFLGRQRRLKITCGAAKDSVQVEGEFLHVASRRKTPLSRSEIRTRLKSWFTARAREFLATRITRWNAKTAIRQAPIVLISDQSLRWGSCNQNGELRFNWRLIGAPVSLVDYVIVHELCHLRWSDHSARFWRDLRRIMPDYIQREHALAQIGPMIVF